MPKRQEEHHPLAMSLQNSNNQTVEIKVMAHIKIDGSFFKEGFRGITTSPFNKAPCILNSVSHLSDQVGDPLK
jgi:hypothetical protein